MQSYFSAYKQVKLTAYARLVRRDETGREIWTEALQTAIDENPRVYIPSGKYFVDGSIVLPSNRQIIANRHAEICLVKGTKTLLLRSKYIIDGRYRTVQKTEPRVQNVMITGGIWAEENERRLGYGQSGTYDEAHSIVGVNACMLFNGVDNLFLRNLTFRNVAEFGVQIGRVKNFEVKNVKFISCFCDGVHLNGDTQNGLVENIKGNVGDDLVALNAYDWYRSTISNGSINRVVVSRVVSPKNARYKAFRLQPGVLPKEQGGIDCAIKNVLIDRVKGIKTFKLYLQTPRYFDAPDGTQVGKMENVRFERVRVNLDGPIDRLPNYLEKDLVTGHMGAFEIGSNVKGLHFKNVRVKINCKDYPATAHWITVGPKSCYLTRNGETYEIFDPYVKCEVDGIYGTNIRINGKKVRDMRARIYEVKFKNLYPAVYGDGVGYGVVKNVQSNTR